MAKILVINGHPHPERSANNSLLISKLEETYGTDLVVSELAKNYPSWEFDIKAEQKLVENADIIILQFPYYNLYMPALLKKYIEEVWHYGFSHGKGSKMQGKQIIHSLTLGLGEDVFGASFSSLTTLFSPMRELMQMFGLPWYVVYTCKAEPAKMPEHFNKLQKLIEELS